MDSCSHSIQEWVEADESEKKMEEEERTMDGFIVLIIELIGRELSVPGSLPK